MASSPRIQLVYAHPGVTRYCSSRLHLNQPMVSPPARELDYAVFGVMVEANG